MRALFATCCFALLLAGCRGPGNGLFGQLTLPPPGTQPPGTLLAGSNYYPGVASPPAAAATNFPAASQPGASAVPVDLGTSRPNSSQITERRGATLTRNNLAAVTRPSVNTAPEEPIRIPSESTAAGGLAAVVPIRGIPTTDATRLFEAVRSQLATAPTTNYAARAGFIEISQLPDASPALRQAALSRQALR